MTRALLMAAGAAVSVLLAFAESPSKPHSASPTPNTSVGIFMDFDAIPTATSLEVMEEEADKLLKPAGVSLDWRMAKENHGDEAFSGLVVLKFKGKCRIEGWSDPNAEPATATGPRALGKTKVDKGKVLPYTEVECDELRNALAYLKPDAGPKERQRALGLALGRVVAHELYHILAHTTTHAKQGLAKATESLQDLLSPGEMGFRLEDSNAIRNGLRP